MARFRDSISNFPLAQTIKQLAGLNYFVPRMCSALPYLCVPDAAQTKGHTIGCCVSVRDLYYV